LKKKKVAAVHLEGVETLMKSEGSEKTWIGMESILT